jgi:hypothetical protein
VAGFAGAVLIMAGIVAVAVAIGAQARTTAPVAAAGALGHWGPRATPAASRPVSVDIPAIGGTRN